MTLLQTTNEILPNLWVGDLSNCAPASELGFKRICVLESPCPYAGCEHYPILVGGVARASLLYAVAARLDELWTLHDLTLLVHCAAGIERSPLTLAWWMVKYGGFTLDVSYAWIKKQHPLAEDRRHWLEKLP